MNNLLARLTAIAAVLFASAVHAETYVYSSSPYTTVTPFGACGTGSCANYTTSMAPSGIFTTSGPLPPNLVFTDVSGLVVSYTFTDGLTTYSSSDPQSRLYELDVNTDASGNPTGATIYIERWQVGAAGHVAGDRLDIVQQQIDGSTLNIHNLPCIAVGVATSGAPDSCTALFPDGSSSRGATLAGAGALLLVATPSVPTLDELGLVLLGVLVAGYGVAAVRRA